MDRFAPREILALEIFRALAFHIGPAQFWVLRLPRPPFPEINKPSARNADRTAAGASFPKQDDIVKFDEQERAALTGAGFAIADDHEAAYHEALVVIGAHDDETFWLTITLPNDTRIVCALPRHETIAAIAERDD